MERPATQLPSDIFDLLDISWAPGGGGLNEFLRELLSCCERWFSSSGASIFLREKDSDTFLISARAGSDAIIPEGATIQAGKGIAGAAVQSGQSLLINDPKDHPLLAHKDVSRKRGIQSALVVPLTMPGNRCLGVINLSRHQGQEPFTSSELHLAEAIARYVALAVSNASMLDEIRTAKDQADAARDQLQAVIESLGVAVTIVDSSGAPIGNNVEAGRMLGDSDERERFSCAPPALRKGLERALASALQGETARLKPKEEISDRTWSVIATPIPSGGATAVIEEITESERTHNERARLNRLAEIGQMTAAIAHEIRNPLTGIRGAAQMCSISPEQSPQFAKIIEQEALKLNALCDEFLEFAKPITLKKRSVKLADLGRRLAAAHFNQFCAAGVTLELEIASAEPTIDLDELRIEQVLRNLLLNALQASKVGDEVRLEIRSWGFVVEDRGCGMPPEVLERLCTPFFTTKPTGTGLGLSTVRKIVEAHGGNLRVRSEAGEGTRFEIVLEPETQALRLTA